MGHIENESQEALFARQVESMMRESFILAERIVREAADRLGSAVRDEFYASTVPMVAERLYGNFHNIAQLLNQATQKDIDAVYDSTENVLAAVRKMNGVSK